MATVTSEILSTDGKLGFSRISITDKSTVDLGNGASVTWTGGARATYGKNGQISVEALAGGSLSINTADKEKIVVSGKVFINPSNGAVFISGDGSFTKGALTLSGAIAYDANKDTITSLKTGAEFKFAPETTAGVSLLVRHTAKQEFVEVNLAQKMGDVVVKVGVLNELGKSGVSVYAGAELKTPEGSIGVTVGVDPSSGGKGTAVKVSGGLSF